MYCNYCLNCRLSSFYYQSRSWCFFSTTPYISSVMRLTINSDNIQICYLNQCLMIKQNYDDFSSYLIWSYFILALCCCYSWNPPILPLLFSFNHTVIKVSLLSVSFDWIMYLIYICYLRYLKPIYCCTFP